MEDRPFANVTGELFAESTEDVAVTNFLEYKCPGKIFKTILCLIHNILLI